MPESGLPAQGAGAGPSVFRSLRHRNFRLWFFGQLISLVGTWMQTIAQSWLVLQLTDSPFRLGLATFAGAIPLVPLTLYAGEIADRFSRRKVVFLMQAAMMVLAFVLAYLCWSGRVQYWHVLLLAILLGAAQALDTPARQAFVVELAGKEDLPNAIALNFGIFHAARVVGPALAGLLIEAVGVTAAFALNGASFIAVLSSLWMMDPARFHREPHPSDGGRDLWAGTRYLREERIPRAIVLLIFVSATLAMPYYILVPVFVKSVLAGRAGAYGVLMSAAGVGAVAGALYAASRGAVRRKGAVLFAGSMTFPVLLLLFAFSRSYWASSLLLAGVGFFLVTQSAPANALLQSVVPDRLRGRVMAVYVSLYLGMSRLGGLLLGMLAEEASVVVALALGAAATLVLSAAVYIRYPDLRRAA